MFKLSNPGAHRVWSLFSLGLILSLLVACGSTPTPEVIVVTATNTPEPVVQVVTATFTPEPLVVTTEASPTTEVVPTDTPSPTTPPPSPTEPPPPTEAVPPTDPPPPTEPPEPEPPPLEFTTYEHPSGFFSLDIPVGADTEEDEDGLYFTYLDSLFMIFYTDMEATLSADDMEALITVLIEDVLMDEDLITSYDNLSVQRSDGGDVVGSVFDATSEEMGEGEGSVILYQVEQFLYMMIMLTGDYDAVEEVWETAVSSLSASPPAPALPPPAPTPTPTTKPKPKPSPTTQQTSPGLPPDKGCFLFENWMDAEANVTFTAKDWQWSDVVFIAPGESKVYCVDPGRYSATVDVPPPWADYNLDLEIQAGEYLSWPIRGE